MADLPTVHHLKCWPESFEAMRRGEKTFDARTTRDRDFRVGDVIVQHLFDPNREVPRDPFYDAFGAGVRPVEGAYVSPDNEAVAEAGDSAFSTYSVTYVLEGPSFGIPAGVSVLSLLPLDPTLALVVETKIEAVESGRGRFGENPFLDRNPEGGS